MVGQSLVSVGQRLLGDLKQLCKLTFGCFYLLATRQIVFSIAQNFRLNNRNQPVLLADGSVTSQHICVLLQSNVRWSVLTDVKDATPLCKSAATLLKLLTALVQVIQSLSCTFSNGAGKIDDTRIEFNPRNSTLLNNQVNKALALVSFLKTRLIKLLYFYKKLYLMESFLEQNYTRNVLSKAGGSKKQLTVFAAVVLGIVQIDRS